MENALTASAGAEAAEAAQVVDEPTGGEEILNQEQEDQEQKPEKTFTQKELDDILKRRLDKSQRRTTKQVEELNRKIEELSKQREETPKKATEQKAEEAPKRDAYDSYEEYLEARADWRTDQKLQKDREERETARAKERDENQRETSQKELMKQAQKRVDAGRKEYADFDSTINGAIEDGIIEPNSELYYGIIESDVGHRLAYYLAQEENHDEAEKLKKLSPRALQRELGKLELKVEKKEKAAVDTMEPLGGTRPVKSADPMREDIGMDEFVRLRNAAEMRRRKG